MLSIKVQVLIHQEHIVGAVAMLCDDYFRERLSKKETLDFIRDTVQVNGKEYLSRAQVARHSPRADDRWEQAEYAASKLFPEYFEIPELRDAG